MFLSKRSIKILTAFTWVVLALTGMYWYYTGALSPHHISETITALGVWAPLLYIVFYALRAFFFFPASVTTPLAAVLFGPVMGWVYAFIGEMISALVSFWAGRFLGHDTLMEYVGNKEYPLLQQFDDAFKEQGFITLLLIRLVPLFPFDIVNFVSGVSSIRFSTYMLATAIGIIPGLTAYIALGSAVHHISYIFWAVGGLALLSLLGVVLRKQLMKYAR